MTPVTVSQDQGVRGELWVAVFCCTLCQFSSTCFSWRCRVITRTATPNVALVGFRTMGQNGNN